MKINRAQLKEVIKECLIEILQEGTSGQKTKFSQVSESSRIPQRPMANDSIVFGKKQQQPKINKDIIRTAAGADPIMMGIFEDTAANTLPKMMDSDRSGQRFIAEARGQAEAAVAAATPEELFGDEMADKWSTLAFSAGPLKNR
jgi:hypothetical protein